MSISNPYSNPLYLAWFFACLSLFSVTLIAIGYHYTVLWLKRCTLGQFLLVVFIIAVALFVAYQFASGQIVYTRSVYSNWFTQQVTIEHCIEFTEYAIKQCSIVSQ